MHKKYNTLIIISWIVKTRQKILDYLEHHKSIQYLCNVYIIIYKYLF